MQNLIKNILFLALIGFIPESLLSSANPTTVADSLGWIATYTNRCGGYYLEPPFKDASRLKNGLIEIQSNQVLFAQHGTSVGEGKVTISRLGQQLMANQAYLYRDPVTGKYKSIELNDHVMLREPNSLVIAKHGFFNLQTQSESLQDILYRTAIYSNPANKPFTPTPEALEKSHRVFQLSAWGQAAEFTQDQPHIYQLKQASYSTCPPNAIAWQVSAKQIRLNQTTGRGVAKHAIVRVKGVPIFYAPYLNFPIDARRQTGFLWPTFGNSSKTGYYFRAPYYINLASNEDMTLTPAYLSKRGLELTDLFRYLTPTSYGEVSATLLPYDQTFAAFQIASAEKYQTDTNPITQAEVNRLEQASTTRYSLSWKNNTRANEHWSEHIDLNYVSDDYYLRDLSNNLNEVTQNQLLQLAEATYQNPYLKFIGRVQAFQTLHPIENNVYQNQYSRLPQLVLSGDYPDAPAGLEYFIHNDLSHFTIRHMPGSDRLQPIGTRLSVQPGLALPLSYPSFYLIPQVQFAATQYELKDITVGNPTQPSRTLPIFDVHAGVYFDKNTSLFHTAYRQTLEPQLYYTYVPYRDQNTIPIFDTTENTLTYDELFTYNRFSGLDRIGDANQISVGITTRLIDQQSGLEKVHLGIGQIFYFENRRVTLCSNDSVNLPCNTTNSAFENPENTQDRSPLAGVISYAINPLWNVTGNSIWNPQTNKLDNQSILLHYQRDSLRIVNLGYTFIRDGDQLVTSSLAALPTGGSNNLSQTDASFSWPVSQNWSTVGRWTQNWNRGHFQNLLYGLQYDSCCWAVRFVTGRAFTNLTPNNTYQYNTQFFIQFALKGLGNVGTGDPSQLLSNSVSGYQTQFGQDF